ncbi:MAG: 6-phosphogluconate dehydrogenase [Chthoniobacteraceae bacterium]|nr:6-phosphogluconate dehydrogenase [Chthoniobacteraceae bacterium]
MQPGMIGLGRMGTNVVGRLTRGRHQCVVCLMVPAAAADEAIADLVLLLEPDDVLIDGGNAYYVDDLRRAREFASKKIHYVDAGTSGGLQENAQSVSVTERAARQ